MEKNRNKFRSKNFILFEDRDTFLKLLSVTVSVTSGELYESIRIYFNLLKILLISIFIRNYFNCNCYFRIPFEFIQIYSNYNEFTRIGLNWFEFPSNLFQFIWVSRTLLEINSIITIVATCFSIEKISRIDSN